MIKELKQRAGKDTVRNVSFVSPGIWGLRGGKWDVIFLKKFHRGTQASNSGHICFGKINRNSNTKISGHVDKDYVFGKKNNSFLHGPAWQTCGSSSQGQQVYPADINYLAFQRCFFF